MINRSTNFPLVSSGVRSLQFHKHLLSIGTGAGRLFFYDIRARKFLDKEAGCECHRPHARMGHCSLKASPGWLVRNVWGYKNYKILLGRKSSFVLR